MKRNLLSLFVALFVVVLPMKALDYESARQQAWFLTDKMAYELNLTNEQYDRAYQINLDYFLSVNSPSDVFGYSWTWRNEDLRYVLFDWQYRLYTTVEYFLRPMRWSGYRWYYPVFNRYRYGYYYFGRPNIYLSYRGGFGHRPRHGGMSPYYGMRFNHGPGMRDTHRPPKKGWGEGRNFRNDGRPADRSGSYNNGNHGGNNHSGGNNNNGNHGGNNHSGGYNNGGNHGGNNHSGGYNNGGNHHNDNGNVGSSNGGGHNNRPGGNSGNVGSSRNNFNRGSINGGSISRPSHNSGSVSSGSSNGGSHSGNVSSGNRNGGSHSGSGSFGRSGSGSRSVSGGGRSSGSKSSGNSGGGNSRGGRSFGR